MTGGLLLKYCLLLFIEHFSKTFSSPNIPEKDELKLHKEKRTVSEIPILNKKKFVAIPSVEKFKLEDSHFSNEKCPLPIFPDAF